MQLQARATHPGDLLLRLAPLAQDEGRVRIVELQREPLGLLRPAIRLRVRSKMHENARNRMQSSRFQFFAAGSRCTTGLEASSSTFTQRAPLDSSHLKPLSSFSREKASLSDSQPATTRGNRPRRRSLGIPTSTAHVPSNLNELATHAPANTTSKSLSLYFISAAL